MLTTESILLTNRTLYEMSIASSTDRNNYSQFMFSFNTLYWSRAN